MKRIFNYIVIASLLTFSLTGCMAPVSSDVETPISKNEEFSARSGNFEWEAEIVDDFGIYRYEVPEESWNSLSLENKQFAYYMSQAGLAGRDMFWNQRYRHNVEIRSILETIYTNYSGDEANNEWKEFKKFTKKVWFTKGIHHNVTNQKHRPNFCGLWFNDQLKMNNIELKDEIRLALFSENYDRYSISADVNKDILIESSMNFYESSISMNEVKEYYDQFKEEEEASKSIEIGLNTRLTRDKNGNVVEETYSVNGLYKESIEQVIYWLNKAVTVAESPKQAKALKTLVSYYETGDLQLWEQHSLEWMEASDNSVDFINGFVEKYEDPLARKGAYESYVYILDKEFSRKMDVLKDNVLWFEQNAPIKEEHKNEEVSVSSAQVVYGISGAGDISPMFPPVMSQPNSEWIRRDVGTKNIISANIINAANQITAGGLLTEFACDEDEVLRALAHGKEAAVIYNQFRMIGYNFGKIEDGVGPPFVTLKENASTIQQLIAQVYSLYYCMSPKIEELGLSSSSEVGMAAADLYFREGLLTNFNGIGEGTQFTNPRSSAQFIACQWVMGHGEGEVVELVEREGKFYYNILNYERLRELVGKLLRQAVNMESKGNYKSASVLVEVYGVNSNPEVHSQVIRRADVLNLASYYGFINPVMTPVFDTDKNITDVKISYDINFDEQMLQYGKEFGHLPVEMSSADTEKEEI